MADLILRDLDPWLLQRVQRLARARGGSLQDMLVSLLDLGLAHAAGADAGEDDHEARVLAAAIRALENVPDDPGFALIGRHVPVAPPARGGPDQSIAPGWTRPGLC